MRSDRAYRALRLRLHDYFIARSVDLLKPGALAAFVTSHGTMDKADAGARRHIAQSGDLIGAIRLPEGSFRAAAGTDVVVDLLFFRKRKVGEPQCDVAWLDLEVVREATTDEGAIRVNRWFKDNPSCVLGRHAMTSGPFGETYTCLPNDDRSLDKRLASVIEALPSALYDDEPEEVGADSDDDLAQNFRRAPR